MDKRDLMAIQELMNELKDKMEFSEDDFNDRLGKPKGVEVIKVEGGEMPDKDLEDQEEMVGEDLDDDMEMGEDPVHAAKVLGAQNDPEEELKRRLMKLRG